MTAFCLMSICWSWSYLNQLLTSYTMLPIWAAGKYTHDSPTWFRYNTVVFGQNFWTNLTDHLTATNKKKSGDAGHRSPYLSHAKRALYHLSYIPMSFTFFKNSVHVHTSIRVCWICRTVSSSNNRKSKPFLRQIENIKSCFQNIECFEFSCESFYWKLSRHRSSVNNDQLKFFFNYSLDIHQIK